MVEEHHRDEKKWLEAYLLCFGERLEQGAEAKKIERKAMPIKFERSLAECVRDDE
jgi:hypothetical protein